MRNFNAGVSFITLMSFWKAGGTNQFPSVQVQEGSAWAGGGWGACCHCWVPSQQAEGQEPRLWKCDIIFPDHTFTVIPNKISRSMLNLSCSLLTALLLFTFYSVLVSTSFVPNFITDSTDHYSLVNTLSEHLAQIVNHHIGQCFSKCGVRPTYGINQINNMFIFDTGRLDVVIPQWTLHWGIMISDDIGWMMRSWKVSQLAYS